MDSEEYGFHDILLAAEQLTSEIESTNELPKVQRNFRQVLEAAQTLHDRTRKEGMQTDADIKATIFLGTKGVDVTRMQQKLEPFIVKTTSATEPSDTVSETDVDGFLRSERMNALCNLIDTCSANLIENVEEKIWQEIDADWREQKREIMGMISGDMAGLQFEPRANIKINTQALTNPGEATYIAEINHYNQAILKNIPKPNLFDRFEVVAQNLDDLNLKELWSSVVAMASGLPSDVGSILADRRGSPVFQRTLVLRAKKYLERSFYSKVQNDVWANLGAMRLSGEPSIIPLIQGYIMLRGIEHAAGLEVGAGDAGPVWAVVYYCLRSGKIKEAANYLREVIGNVEMATMVEELDSGGILGLPSSSENKMRLEYRRIHKNNTKDIFKLAVFCILGACDVGEDHHEVAVRLDDYLWLKLSQVRDNSDNRYSADFLTYSSLQTLIYEKYGETYFDAFQQPYVYFEALILTGQFEPAIDFLSRIAALRSHAVHIAIALNENSILLTSGPKDSMMTKKDFDPPGLRRINFCHLVLGHAKILQSTSLRDAINYLYFLRAMTDDGVDLFSVCVSEIVADARDFSLFGGVSEDGCRTPGLLETMGINIQPIILFCANDSETRGMFEDAIILFDLANKHERALQAINRVMCQVLTSVPQPDSQRSRIQNLAISLAERYQKQPPNVLNRTVSATFYLLIDCMTFFDEYYSKRYESALMIIERLTIIPLRGEDVERSVDAFHGYCDEIRTNIPDIILATMDALLKKYNKLKVERKTNSLTADGGNNVSDFLGDMRVKAKALVTYCGMIPYFMTGDVYTKVMQKEVQMS